MYLLTLLKMEIEKINYQLYYSGILYLFLVFFGQNIFNCLVFQVTSISFTTLKDMFIIFFALLENLFQFLNFWHFDHELVYEKICTMHSKNVDL